MQLRGRAVQPATVIESIIQNPQRNGPEVSGPFHLQQMIFDHTHNAYSTYWRYSGDNKHNGAYYYSREIVENIIPRVDTDRSWVTVNVKGLCCEHAIVFVHNNQNPERYEWLKRYGYKDLVLVCGIPETVEKVAHIGKAIYLPLSIDVSYVRQFRTDKTKDTAYVGRPSKRKGLAIPDSADILEGLPRDELLRQMAKYEKVYAVGRCALEAKALHCKILPYDPRYPDPTLWRLRDNKTAAKYLQAALDEIDGVRNGERVCEKIL